MSKDTQDKDTKLTPSQVLLQSMDEAYNQGIDHVTKLIGSRYGTYLACGIEKTNPEGWAILSVELFEIMEQIKLLKKP